MTHTRYRYDLNGRNQAPEIETENLHMMSFEGMILELRDDFGFTKEERPADNKQRQCSYTLQQPVAG